MGFLDYFLIWYFTGIAVALTKAMPIEKTFAKEFAETPYPLPVFVTTMFIALLLVALLGPILIFTGNNKEQN